MLHNITLTFYPIFLLPTLPLWLLPLLQLTLAIPLRLHSLFPRRSPWVSALSGPPFFLNLRHSPWASGALSKSVALSLGLRRSLLDSALPDLPTLLYGLLCSPWAFSALSRPAVLSLRLWHSLLGSSVLGLLALSLGLRALSRLLALPETCWVFCHWLCIYSKYYKVARLNNFSNVSLPHSLD